jgi:hypothetical protein
MHLALWAREALSLWAREALSIWAREALSIWARETLPLFNFHVKGPVLRELLLAAFLEDLDRRVRITLGERGLLSLDESGSLYL